MRNGVVLFSSDRGIRPAALAKAAEDRGFDTIYVPEHTHIPVKRTAAHPGTGDESLPDDRYLRTLDPWTSLATCAAVTERIGLSTAVWMGYPEGQKHRMVHVHGIKVTGGSLPAQAWQRFMAVATKDPRYAGRFGPKPDLAGGRVVPGSARGSVTTTTTSTTSTSTTSTSAPVATTSTTAPGTTASG